MQEELWLLGMKATEPFVKCYFAIPHGIIASPEEEQRKEQNIEMGMVLLCSPLKTVGQIEPGVSSTKDNHTASEDSVRPQDTEALTNPPGQLTPIGPR